MRWILPNLSGGMKWHSDHDVLAGKNRMLIVIVAARLKKRITENRRLETDEWGSGFELLILYNNRIVLS